MKIHQIPRVMTSGIVITKRIGKSAAKPLSALMQAYGEGSETIMEWV
jgi:hypothetical protein